MIHNASDHSVFGYNQIDDHVFIGTNVCCAKHFKQKLLKKGVTADISLEDEQTDPLAGISTYLWLPTEDRQPPTRSQVETGSAALDHLIRTHQLVYIHSHKGCGRAPTFYAAFLILRRGLSKGAALEAIRVKRPATYLSQTQIQFLETLKPSNH